MTNKNQPDRKGRVLLVAKDAGGANILAAWARQNKKDKLFLVAASGPAKFIFKRSGLAYKAVALHNYFKKIKKTDDFILIGTSLPPGMEQKAVMLARKNNLKCAVFLDHWINYKERFLTSKKSRQLILPDEIWVGDKFALSAAIKANFPKNILRFKNNPYFEEAKAYFRKRRLVKRRERKEILFVSAPISVFQKSGAVDKVNEFDQLKMLLEASKKKNVGGLTIRFHPSEKMNKFDKMLKANKYKFKVNKLKSSDIKGDIIKSDIVVGAESMGLVLAVLAKKKVISILPPKVNKILLPFKSIIKAHSIKELTKNINAQIFFKKI